MSAARTDANHAEIRDGLRAMGYAVADTHVCGHGFPDLVVLAKSGRVVLLEVKAPGGKLTQAEKEFYQRWRVAVRVVNSLEHAITEMEYQDERD